jgi:hypothetical protein
MSQLLKITMATHWPTLILMPEIVIMEFPVIPLSSSMVFYQLSGEVVPPVCIAIMCQKSIKEIMLCQTLRLMSILM